MAEHIEDVNEKLDIIINRLNQHDSASIKDDTKYLRHINEIAAFLDCCPATAQTIKNKMPLKSYCQFGRKFMIQESVLIDFLKNCRNERRNKKNR